MVNKTFNIPLDLKLPSATEVEVVEGDSGNILVITLTDDGTAVDLDGCKVLAVFSRPDGATVEQDTDNHGVTIGGTDNNVVTISLYTNSFRPGTVACELQVYSGTNQTTLTTSARFTFECRRSIMNDDTILSEEKYPILVAMISTVQGLIESVASAIQSAAARVQANWTQTDNSKTDYIKNKPTAFTPSAHASSHGSNGSDAVTPSAIGAAEAVHATRHASGGADPVVSKWEKTLEPSAWSDGIIDMALPVTEANVVLIQGISDDDKKNFAKAEIAVTHISTGIRFTATTTPETNIALNVAAI